MLNIPETVKALYKRDGVRKNFRAHFPNGELPDITNENLVQESVKFTESVCSQDIFKFGLTEASVIEFETVGVANMYGMTIECSNEIDCSSLSAGDIADIEAGTWGGEYVPLADSDLGYAFYRVPYGVFTVDSCPRNHEAMAHRQVTAYSTTFSDASSNLPGIPEESGYVKLSIDPAAFITQITHTGLTELEIQNTTGGMFGNLFDSSGKCYIFSPRISDARTVRTRTAGPSVQVSFVETDLQWDENEWRALGNDFADQLTALGYDLTYNAKKQKVFADNRQALENAVPALFGPTIWSSCAGGIRAFWEHIKPGVLYPAITDFTTETAGAFTPSIQIAPGTPSFQMTYFHTPRETPTCSLEECIAGGTAQTVGTLSPTVTVPTLDSAASVKLYKYAGAAFPRIAVDNMGLSRVASAWAVNAAGTAWVAYNRNMFSFVGAYDPLKTTAAMAELTAQFGKVNRNGEAEFIRLDNSSPIAVTPPEYSSLWWDEYEVEPIGTIRYSFIEDGQQTLLDYKFGQGASVYDISGNEVFRSATRADQSAIIANLSTNFIPYLGPVNFVPIDLEMKGLPYIEAGDALAITAEDGTTVNSYALRIEISGIQALTMTVESAGGLIIESEGAT